MNTATLILCCLVALLAPGQLNVVNATRRARIINGDDVQVGEIPYQVSLQDNYNVHFCGGVIINEFWIITAAHCLEDESTDSFKVVAGMVSRKQPYSSHGVEKIIVHENWNEENSYPVGDIGLIKLSSPFQISSRIKPVKLPESYAEVKTNTSAIISGWGDTEEHTDRPDVMRKATVYVTDQEVCRDFAKKYGYYGDIRETNICAYDPPNIRGSCYGDSGGPLTADGVLIGISSWGISDLCDQPYPNVFTRVTKYIDWIHEHTNMTNNY